jgi:hypothetical protein
MSSHFRLSNFSYIKQPIEYGNGFIISNKKINVFLLQILVPITHKYQHYCIFVADFRMTKLLVLILLLAHPLLAHRTTAIQHRVNYGVIFTETTTIDNTQQNWRHTFHLTLPHEFDVGIVPPVCSLINSGNQSCQEVNTLFQDLEKLRTEAKSRLNAITTRIPRLLPEQKHTPFTSTHKRTSRSLLPFIGQMSKYLFGTASEQDLLVLQTHMKTIISRTDKLTHSFEQHAVNLSSYMMAIDFPML